MALEWKSSSESIQRYHQRLEEGGESIIFPYKSIWSFRGLAKVIPVGKLVGILGMSGGMKTGFMETVADAWRSMDAIDILWWGTEWTWEEMTDRQIQRYGGSRVDEMLLHRLWLDEASRGIPEAARKGEAISEGMIARNKRIADQLETWAGWSHYLTEPVTELDLLLTAMTERINYLRSIDHPPKVVVFDYAQLLDLWVGKSEHEKLTLILGRIKVFCLTQHVVGMIASQVTKASSKDAKAFDSTLEAEDGQSFRADKFNLFLTLRPIYTSDGRLITDHAEINVAKNSLGSSGLITVYIDPAHLRWIDKVYEE